MKVKEVIEILTKLDPDKELVMPDLKSVEDISLSKDESLVIVSDVKNKITIEEFEYELFSMSVKIDGNEEKLIKALNDLDFGIDDTLAKSIETGAVTLMFGLKESDRIYFYINTDILESETIINLFYEALSADVPKSFGITDDIVKRETIHLMKVIMIAKGEI